MNKDHLEAFLATAMQKYGICYKQEEKEGRSWWIWKENPDPEWKETRYRIQSYIDKCGWGIDHSDWVNLTNYKVSGESFFGITYDENKDKISLNRFETGYRYTELKQRIYVVRRRIPLLCFSKKIYAFQKYRRGGYKPRIYTGRLYQVELEPYLQEYLHCPQETLRMFVPYRYMNHEYGSSIKQWPEMSFFQAFDGHLPSSGFMDRMNLKTSSTDSWNMLINLGGKSVKGLCQFSEWCIEEGNNQGQQLLYNVHELMKF